MSNNDLADVSWEVLRAGEDALLFTGASLSYDELARVYVAMRAAEMRADPDQRPSVASPQTGSDARKSL